MDLIKKKMLFLFSILALPFVSAQGLPRPERAIEEVIGSVQNIFTPIFSVLFGSYISDEFLFAKILLAILLFVVINAVMQKMPQFRNQKGVSAIIAIVISIFAVRFISENDLVSGILLPYGALGVALTAILPFLIFFYFIHDSQMGSFGRRITWFFFAVVFVVLWYAKSSDLGGISNQIYGWTLAGVTIAFIFDGNIHQYFGMFEESRRRRASDDRARANIEAELDRLSMISNPSDSVRRTIEHLKERHRELR